MRKNRDSEKLAAAFKALSNENRLKIFMLIREGRNNSAKCGAAGRPADVPAEAICVCEILERMDITAPTLSHHLKELRFAGLVDVFNSGRWSYYTVKPGALKKMAEFFSEKTLCEKV